jgi:DNA repair photolyase
MQVLAEHGIRAGVTMMPILPFIEDNVENVRAVVEQAQAHGARYILPAFGMTLRDRQRAYYYEKLGEHFPGVREQYRRKFGGSYSASANHIPQLETVFYDLCECYGIANAVPQYRAEPQAKQLSLF